MGELSIRRVRDADAVLQHVIDRQPMSVDIVDRVERTRQRTHWKAHVIERDGSFVGMFFQYRLCRGMWEAILLLDEPALDTVIVEFVDRAHVWSIAGPGDDAKELLGRLPRLTRLTKLEMFHERTPPEYWSALPGATSMGEEHADKLVEFFSHHERFGIPTMAGIRELVNLALQRGPAIVVEEDDEIVAGLLLAASTGEWIAIDALSVRPDRRGRGLSTILLSGVTRMLAGGGVGVCGLRASTNPAGYEAHAGKTDWFVANMRPPKRFRGHQRLRVLSLRFRVRAMPWATTYVRPEHLDEDGRLRRRPADPLS